MENIYVINEICFCHNDQLFKLLFSSKETKNENQLMLKCVFYLLLFGLLLSLIVSTPFGGALDPT